MQSFPEFNLFLTSSWMQFRSVTVIPQYSNFAIFSKDLLKLSKLRFCPGFWRQVINIHSVFSVFTSRPTYLVASNRASVFFFMVFTFSPSVLF
jgi:hypothetical protein